MIYAKKLFRTFAVTAAISAAFTLHSNQNVTAQTVRSAPTRYASEVIAGRFMVLVRPEAVTAVQASFAEGNFSDPMKAVVRDGKSIVKILGLPEGLKITGLRPYLPQHSVAFPTLRVKTNPELFDVSKSVNIAGSKAKDLSALRSSEDRLARWFVVEYDASVSPEAASAMSVKSSLIEIAEPKLHRFAMFTSNDPLDSLQWAIKAMKLNEAWDIAKCDSTMIVADVDAGTYTGHEDLKDAINHNLGEMGLDQFGEDKRSNGVDDDGNGFVDDWQGWDFSGYFGGSPDNNPGSMDGHGNHTAGTIAATGNNKLGVIGVAFGARLVPIKAANDWSPGQAGSNPIDFGFEGIAYAADMHAKAINCSWGGHTFSAAEQDVTRYAYAKDAVICAAAGNWSTLEDVYPAAYANVLSVGGVRLGDTGNLEFAVDYSDFGYHVDVLAPGSGIISSVYKDPEDPTTTGYEYSSGTSMATPHATGAIALIRQKFPNYTAAQAQEHLRVTCDTIDDPFHADLMGKGAINMLRALSTTKTFSARIINAEVHGDQGEPGPGKTAAIVVHVKNILSPLSQLRGRVEIVEGGEHVKITTDPDVVFGSVGTLEETSNLQAAFRIEIDTAVPENQVVVMKVKFHDDVVGYTNDVEYFSFIVYTGYKDLDANDLRVTITSIGSVGFNDPMSNREGNGIVWEDAPSGFETKSTSILYAGGLMLGYDTVHLVSAVLDTMPKQIDHDFKPTVRVHDVEPLAPFIQTLHTQFDDSNADSVKQVGVIVDHYAHALPGKTSKLDYIFRKRTPTNGEQQTDDLAAALYFDFDLGPGGSLNDCYVKDSVAVVRRNEPGYPFVGVKVIEKPAVGELNIHMVDNNGSSGSFNLYDTFRNSAKWITMNIGRDFAGVGDVSEIVGVKGMKFKSVDSVRLSFLVAVAESEDSLMREMRRQTNRVRNLPDTEAQHSSVNYAEASTPTLSAYPNPFSSAMTLSWQAASKDQGKAARVTMFDALGRVVMRSTTSAARIDMTGLDLVPGSYYAEVVQGSTRLRKEVVKLK